MADPEPGCLAGSRNGRLESGHLLLSQEAWSKRCLSSPQQQPACRNPVYFPVIIKRPCQYTFREDKRISHAEGGISNVSGTGW